MKVLRPLFSGCDFLKVGAKVGVFLQFIKLWGYKILQSCSVLRAGKPVMLQASSIFAATGISFS